MLEPLTDSAYRKTKKRIEKFLSWWIPALGLRWWRIDINWTQTDLTKDLHCSVLAQCWASWQYRKATLQFDVKQFSDMSDDDIEEAVVHKLCHILVNPLHPEPKMMAHEEYAVSMLTNAFLFARNRILKQAGRGSAKATLAKRKRR